jgi:hypothetical protein
LAIHIGVAIALASFVGFAILIWTPVLLLRDKGMSLHEIAYSFRAAYRLHGFNGTMAAVKVKEREKLSEGTLLIRMKGEG